MRILSLVRFIVRVQTSKLLTLSTCLALMSLATPAWADAIDGDWCLSSSHFRIDGPTITTPGGNSLQGNYTRHDFSYVVPTNEPGAGSEIRMRLLSEDVLDLYRAAGAPAETWRRCKPIS